MMLPVRVLTFVSATVAGLACTLVAAQSLTPVQRGDCPPPPPGVQNSIGSPPLTAPAHYFAPDGGRAGVQFPFRVSVWRAPCPGHPDNMRAWVKLTDATNAALSPTMPIITVQQNGKRLGTLPSMISGPSWVGLISDIDDLPPPRTIMQGAGFSLIGRETVAFDPKAAFTLFIEPRDGPWGPLDVRVDVPDASAPGNIGLIPQWIGGLWWNPARPGWGVVLDRNEREVVFAIWLTYNEIGESIWFVMPNGTAAQDGTVTGAVYAPTGKPFSVAAPWPVPGVDMGPVVGQFRIRFDSQSAGTFAYDVNGVSGTEPIKPIVIPATVANAGCRNSSGLWYDNTRDGWGVALEDSAGTPYCPEHFSLVTYDEAGKTAWYFAPLMPTGQFTFGAPNWFSGVRPRYAIKEGPLYRPSGTGFRPAQSAIPFAIGAQVGSVQIQWAADGLVRSDVRIGDLRQVIDLRKFRFEY